MLIRRSPPHRRRPRCLQSFLLPTWLAPEPHGNDEGERRPGSDRGPPLVGVLRESREVDGVLPTRWLQPRPGRTPPACVGAGRVADEERQVAAFDLAHPPPGIDAEYQLVQPPPGASPRSTPMSNAIPAARSIPASRALSSVTYSARLAPAVAPNGPAPRRPTGRDSPVGRRIAAALFAAGEATAIENLTSALGATVARSALTSGVAPGWGISSQVRPSRSRPPAFGVRPPHC